MKHFFDDLPAWLVVLIFCIIFVLVIMAVDGCATSKNVHHETTDSVRVEVRERIVKVPDTIFFEIPAQTTERTTQDTTSILSTDFAVSLARITPDGYLFHSLANIATSRPVYIEKEVLLRDSVFVEKAGEVLTITETIKEKPSLLQRAQAVGFWLLLVVVVTCGAMFLVRK